MIWLCDECAFPVSAEKTIGRLGEGNCDSCHKVTASLHPRDTAQLIAEVRRLRLEWLHLGHVVGEEQLAGARRHLRVLMAAERLADADLALDDLDERIVACVDCIRTLDSDSERCAAHQDEARKVLGEIATARAAYRKAKEP